MPVTERSRPFFFTFGTDTGGDHKQTGKIISVNSFEPVEIENEHFRGRVLLIHETGSEPGLEDDDWVGDDRDDIENAGDVDGTERRQMRGVELQIQGKFMHPLKESKDSDGFWVVAELRTPLKLGWVMGRFVNILLAFIKKKSDGRLYYCLGKGEEPAHMSFPVCQVFTCVTTPPGEEPPRLGTPDLDTFKWQGSKPVVIDTENTYTFFYKTPFVDACTWELLNVPGVCPMAGEKFIGDVTVVRIAFYDASAAPHARPRDGALLEFVASRGEPGDTWLEGDAADGSKTPLEEASDLSEASDDIDLVDGEDQASGSEDDSESDDDPIEDEDALSNAESEVLCAIDAWKPSEDAALQLDAGCSVKVLYYIEAIGRRRAKNLNVWYIFEVRLPGGESWFTTLAIQQLKSLVHNRPRMVRTFRRGNRARVAISKRYNVVVLEKLRYAIIAQFGPEEKPHLRRAVRSAAVSGILPTAAIDCFGDEESNKESSTKDVQDRMLRRQKRVIMPPRFFSDGSSRACLLAFASAKEGRGNVVHEGLVGSLQFEGRICEELLRVSSDGMIRVFAAHDCDKPRVKIARADVLLVKPIEGLFLGRFFLWEVHTNLRVFVFCSGSQADCFAWITALQSVDGSGSTSVSKVKRSIIRTPFSSSSNFAFLRDTTRARRWHPSRRLVLNDRRLLAPERQPASALVVAAQLLERILSLPSHPGPELQAEFTDSTCALKAVRVDLLSQVELLPFWMNVYHCLLIHGRMVLGTPKSRRELARFNQRVSYLVALVPLSLREIERYILRVPRSDTVAMNVVTSRVQKTTSNARSHARQLLGRFQFRGNEAPQKVSRQGRRQSAPGYAYNPLRCLWDRSRCLPMVPLPVLSKPWKTRAHACLFLGVVQDKNKGFSVLCLDLRLPLCLNRADMACLPDVPIFTKDGIAEQLDEVSERFVAAFVRIREERFMIHPVITLPQSLRGIHRQLELDDVALTNFVRKFLPPPDIEAEKFQVVFQKHRGEPRPLGTLKKLKYIQAPAAHVDPLHVDLNDFDLVGRDVGVALDENATHLAFSP